MEGWSEMNRIETQRWKLPRAACEMCKSSMKNKLWQTVALCFVRYRRIYLHLFPRLPGEVRVPQGMSYRLNLDEEQCEEGARGKKMMFWVRSVSCDSNYLWLAGKLTID